MMKLTGLFAPRPSRSNRRVSFDSDVSPPLRRASLASNDSASDIVDAGAKEDELVVGCNYDYDHHPNATIVQDSHAPRPIAANAADDSAAYEEAEAKEFAVKDDDDQSEASLEANAETLQTMMNVEYDFSAWESFRASVGAEKRASAKEWSRSVSNFGSFNLDEDYEEDDELELTSEEMEIIGEDDIGKERIGEAVADAAEEVVDGEEKKEMVDGEELSREASKNLFETIEDLKGQGPNDEKKVPSRPGLLPHQQTSFLAHKELELTSEEKYENAKWRMRQQDRKVFAWDYHPLAWERKERQEIVRFLSLKDPSKEEDIVENSKPQDWRQKRRASHDSEPEEEPMSEATKRAIGSLFFPAKNECESILLKRGPVLVGGEERELMVFTYGFVLSRVELDTLLNLLLNASAGSSSENKEDLTLEQVAERFCSIDADGSGTIDREEIRTSFRRSGIALSESSLDTIMRRLDTDSDGEVSVDEFRAAMMRELGDMVDMEADNAKLAGFSWGKLSSKFKNNLAKDGVTRKLDVAYQMSDIEKIEHVGQCIGHKIKGRGKLARETSILAQQTFAIYPRGLAEPLVVTCAKPGHVDPWMEAFGQCIGNLRLDSSDNGGGIPEGYCKSSGVIHGADRVKTNRKSVEQWRGGAVDWGFDD